MEFSHQHPGVRHVADGGKEPILILSDLISFRDLRRLDLYNESYKIARFRDQAALILPRKNSVLAIAIGSPTSIASENNSILDFLYPHFLQAQRNALLAHTSEAPCDAGPFQYAEIITDRSCLLPDWPEKVRQVLNLFFDSVPGHPWTPPPELMQWINRRRQTITEGFVSWRRLSPLRIQKSGGFLHINLSLTPDKTKEALCFSWKIKDPAKLPWQGKLTDREQEIASWVGQGKSNGEIALILGISLHTVRKHVENIFAKLGMENRVALALLATQR